MAFSSVEVVGNGDLRSRLGHSVNRRPGGPAAIKLPDYASAFQDGMHGSRTIVEAGIASKLPRQVSLASKRPAIQCDCNYLSSDKRLAHPMVGNAAKHLFVDMEPLGPPRRKTIVSGSDGTDSNFRRYARNPQM